MEFNPVFFDYDGIVNNVHCGFWIICKNLSTLISEVFYLKILKIAYEV